MLGGAFVSLRHLGGPSRPCAGSSWNAGLKTGEIWRTKPPPTVRLVILGMMLSTTTTVTFYLITAYMPTFGDILHLSARESMIVTLCVGCVESGPAAGDGRVVRRWAGVRL